MYYIFFSFYNLISLKYASIFEVEALRRARPFFKCYSRWRWQVHSTYSTTKYYNDFYNHVNRSTRACSRNSRWQPDTTRAGRRQILHQNRCRTSYNWRLDPPKPPNPGSWHTDVYKIITSFSYEENFHVPNSSSVAMRVIFIWRIKRKIELYLLSFCCYQEEIYFSLQVNTVLIQF